MSSRTATIERNTRETRITLTVDLDGSGASRFDTGIPFFEHMLEQVARHGVIDFDLAASGDLAVDDHHTVEDTGIVLGQAVAQALGDKRGIARYGHAYVPLDEALSRVVIDFSGRPGLFYRVGYPRARNRIVRRGPDPGVLSGVRERGNRDRAHRLVAGRQRAPHRGDGVQGVRTGASHGGGAGRSNGRDRFRPPRGVL